MSVRLFLAALLLPFVGAFSSAFSGETSGSRFLGYVDVSVDFPVGEVPFGGLSGLTPLGGGSYLAISDRHGRPTVYVLHIELEKERLLPAGVRVESKTPLRSALGRAMRGRFDSEGIARAEDGHYLVADEGNAGQGVPSRLLWFDAEMRAVGEIDLPAKVLPVARTRATDSYGIRRNLGLESLAITPDGRWVVTATEQAMVQDGPIAGRNDRSPARILTFEAKTGKAGPEYVYEVERFPTMMEGMNSIERTGLAELLALDAPGAFLALERSFTLLGGFKTKLYRIDLAQATDVSRHPSLPSGYRPVEKVELLDLVDIGAPPENYEGMALGPRLGDRWQVIYLISDDNFNPLQNTRLVAIALDLSRERFANTPPGKTHDH